MTDKNLELNYFNAEYTAPRTLRVQVGSDVTPVDGLNYDIRLADATNMKGRVRSDFTIESFTDTDDVPVAVETVVPTNYITSANFSTSIYDDFRVTVVRQENNSFNVFVDVLEGENSFQVASKNTFNLFDIDLFYDNTKPFSELSSSSSSSAEEVEIRGINVFSTLSVADLATYGITVISQITSVQNSEGVYVTAGDWSKVTSVSIVKDAMKSENGIDFSDYREILDGGVIHRYRNDSIYALRQGRLYRRGYDFLKNVKKKIVGGSPVYRTASLPTQQLFERVWRYSIDENINAFKIDDEANFNNSYFYSYDEQLTKTYTRLSSWEENCFVIKFVVATETDFNNAELDIYKRAANNFVLKDAGDTYSAGNYFRIYRIAVPSSCSTIALMKFKYNLDSYTPFTGDWNTTDQIYRIVNITGSTSAGTHMSTYYSSAHDNNESVAKTDDWTLGFILYNTQLLHTYELTTLKNSEVILWFSEGVIQSYSEGFVRDGEWEGWSDICCNGMSMLLLRNRRLYKYGAFPKVELVQYTYTYANGSTETRKYAKTNWVVYNSPVVVDTSETWDSLYLNPACYGEYGGDFSGLQTIYAVKIDGSVYKFDNDTLSSISNKPRYYSSSRLTFGQAQENIDNFKIWIDSGGRLMSLGNNQYGQLGRGYFSGYDTNQSAVNSDLTSWTEVACAYDFAIGIADTQLYAWGKFKFDSEDEVTGDIDNFYDSPTLLDYGDGWSGLYVNSSDEVFAIKEQRVYKITPETQTLLSGDLLNFTSLVGQVSQEAPYADSAAVADLLDALTTKAFLTIRNYIDTSGDSSSSSSEDANELVDSVGIYFGKLNIISSLFNVFTFSFSYSRDVAATYDETIGDFAFADYQEHQFGQNELGVNTHLDAYLTATGGDFLSGQFIVYAAVKNVTSYEDDSSSSSESSSSSGDLSNYDVGVYVPLELEIIYYPNEITIARTDSKTKYINSSASRAKLPITSKYGEGVDALAIDYSSMSVVFEEDDATEWIEYAGENFIYVLENSDGNIYRVELPFGIPPASTAEGYTISGIVTPSNANGFYQKSTDVAGYPCYILSGTNICMRYSSNVYNYNTGTYGGIVIASYNGSPENLGTNYFSTTNWQSTMGFDPVAFTWTANYESSGSPVFTFVPEKVEEGSKTLGIRLFDEYGNKSTIIENILIVIAQPSFTNVSLRLLGSSGNDGYTGFYERNGRFFPSDYVEMQFTCQSKLPLFYQITGDVLCDTETIYSISENDTLLTKTVKADVGSITDTIIGKDTAVNITLRFIDDAGNEITASDSIQYISILHRFPHQNVKEDSESYHTTLYKKLGNSTTVLSQKTVSATEFTRNWEDYFWPSNHGYPLLTDGSIDEDTALRISLPNIDAAGNSGPTPSELAIYDRLVISGNNLSNASLVVDNEGRYSTVWTGTKYYTNNTNNRLAKDGLGMVYYIIDNTGRADFQLEFEHFDFDRNVTLLPRNIASPYDGDCLVIYDVSAPGCLSEDKRTFLDTSLMVEIMAFTGSYKNNSIVSLSNSASSFTSSFTKTATGFIAPNIINTSLIAVVPFTDSNFTASGFKLKAGPKQSVEYYNYELYNTLGEVWCHEASGDGSSYAGLTQVMATYSYYTSSAVVDHDRANIRFEERPANVILGSFTTYSYLYSDGRVSESPSLYFGGDVRKFLLYNDDLVDYNEPAICVVPSGTNANFVDIYDFSGTESLAGKLTSNYSMNKDKGVLTFAMGVVVPKGRLFANYFYHTLERLTNDGYHDLFFADAYLVPAVAADNAFKDWTHANLKIVNEGSAALTGGVLKFLARGYVSSANTVDTVLDENRPWDVQKGSSAETVSRTGGSANVTYENLPVPSRSNAVTAIGQGQSVSFGSLLPKDQVFIRVFWSLALNADGTQFVNDTTRGDKMWSAEMAGRYMTLEID